VSKNHVEASSLSDVLEKFDRIARGYSEHDYADPVRYAARRAQVIVELGPRLVPGQSVLDLGCGDGIMAAPLRAHGLAYSGADASTGMIDAARVRNPGLRFEVGRSEEYEPSEPVDATICLRSFYYPADRQAFFRRVAGYTRVKFVFDFRPRDHPPDSVVADLRAAGFGGIELRPFFLPQLRRLPTAVVPAVYALERTGPLASFASRWYGRMFCAALPRGNLLDANQG
jgi:SAM-dependent methyltransferase